MVAGEQSVLPALWSASALGVAVVSEPRTSSLATDRDASAVLASTANEASPEGAGCCLILPIAPVTTAADGVVDASTKVEPLHGAWEDVLDLFETSAWSLRPERWSVRVHGSLARLILHATCAPPS